MFLTIIYTFSSVFPPQKVNFICWRRVRLYNGFMRHFRLFTLARVVPAPCPGWAPPRVINNNVSNLRHALFLSQTNFNYQLKSTAFLHGRESIHLTPVFATVCSFIIFYATFFIDLVLCDSVSQVVSLPLLACDTCT